jgi:hypothetical protein
MTLKEVPTWHSPPEKAFWGSCCRKGEGLTPLDFQELEQELDFSAKERRKKNLCTRNQEYG